MAPSRFETSMLCFESVYGKQTNIEWQQRLAAYLWAESSRCRLWR